MTDQGTFVVDRRTWVHDVAFTAISALVYAFLAPFGTNLVPLQERVVQNFVLGFASFAILWPPMRLALRLGERAGLPELFVVIAGLTILTAPVALVSRWIMTLFYPSIPPSSPLVDYFIVLTLMPISGAYLMVERRLARPRPPSPVEAAGPERPAKVPARLLARLSPRLGGEILALQGEDHYVRVHTGVGSELVLMRLGDAIQELDGLEGERVHRSWWVARGALGEARVDGRRACLTLTNGIEVMASREATVELRRAGWFTAPGRR